jgi:hypothetical protein
MMKTLFIPEEILYFEGVLYFRCFYEIYCPMWLDSYYHAYPTI